VDSKKPKPETPPASGAFGTGKTGTGPVGFGTEKGGELPVGVVFVLNVPAHWRRLPKKEIRRRLANPENVKMLLDNMAATIDEFFKKPVNYNELIRNLAGTVDASGEG
jgi:hypothetical protein